MMLYFAQLGVLIQFRVNHDRRIEAQTTIFCLDILVMYSRTLTSFLHLVYFKSASFNHDHQSGFMSLLLSYSNLSTLSRFK